MAPSTTPGPPPHAGVAPAVSVVIPTRDRRELLSAALSTVLAQEDASLDVLVIDDGSLVPLPEEGAPWDDPRIRVLRRETSGGVARARNWGIEEARGSWIAFLDDDDLWAPTKLIRQLSAAEAAGANFVYAGVAQITFDGALVNVADPPPAEDLLQMLRCFNAVPAGASNVLATADLLSRTGGFDPEFTHLADWDLWIRLARTGRAATCGEPLVGYRLHAESMRSTAGGVLPEVRALDAKHHLRAPGHPERIWVYRWLASGQELAGNHRAAALTYARGALRCRRFGDLRTAAAAARAGRGPDVSTPRATAGVTRPAWLPPVAERASDTAISRAETHRSTDALSPTNSLRSLAAGVLRRPLASCTLWWLRRTSLAAGVALVYHEVTPEPVPAGAPEVVPRIDAHTFRAQVEHVCSAYVPVSARELPGAVRARRPGEPFPVALTFDDDLRSHVETVAPILDAAGAVGTFFLTGASLSGPSSFWWETLQRALDADLQVAVDRFEAEGDKTQAAAALLEELGGELPDSGLRADHVGHLGRSGTEIGFHTRRHDRLTDLDDRALSLAMADGLDDVAKAAGTGIATIAYPHGAADSRVARAAAGAGFSVGFTTSGDPVHDGADLHLLGRLYPCQTSAAALGLQIVRALMRAWRKGR